MIWGIPRSKGGIVNRKPFRLMLYVLFLIAILVGCAKSPQASEEVTMPTDKDWHLLILSDSSGWGLGKAYAPLIEKDVGVKVVLEDYAVGGLTIGELLNALKNEAPIRNDLSGLSAAISDAEVVVMYVASPDGSFIPENQWEADGCIDVSTGYIPVNPLINCNPAALEQYTTDLKWIWGEIFRLRNGNPTILRSMDLYNPWISMWNEKDIYLACTRCWENQNNAFRLAAEAYHIPFVHRYDAYNGVNHDEDPREKGYIRSDGTHPSDLGAQVTAELLAQLGYDPVPPP
jgi:lysophospholipase L1-like esterase